MKSHAYACRVAPDPPEPLVCAICGKPAVALCDYRKYWHLGPVVLTFGKMLPEFNPIIASINTCDRLLCAEHAFHAGPNEDYCPDHCSEVSRARSRRAESAFRDQCRKIEIDVFNLDT